MMQGVQTVFQEAGEAACYVFALGNVAEEFLARELNPWDVVVTAIDGKYVHYDKENPNDPDNFFTSNPEGFLKALTGVPWSVRYEGSDYVPKTGEYAIQCWARKTITKTITHFCRETWNSLIDSATVRHGKIISQRICVPLSRSIAHG
jgi:hypothetical protein